MNWADWRDFLAMGGYGLYVWAAYGLTAALMLLEPVLAIVRYRRALHGDYEPEHFEPADESAA